MKKITFTNKVFQRGNTDCQYKDFTFETEISDKLYNRLYSEADEAKDFVVFVAYKKNDKEIDSLFQEAQRAAGDSDEAAEKGNGYPWYILKTAFPEKEDDLWLEDDDYEEDDEYNEDDEPKETSGSVSKRSALGCNFIMVLIVAALGFGASYLFHSHDDAMHYACHTMRIGATDFSTGGQQWTDYTACDVSIDINDKENVVIIDGDTAKYSEGQMLFEPNGRRMLYLEFGETCTAVVYDSLEVKS